MLRIAISISSKFPPTWFILSRAPRPRLTSAMTKFLRIHPACFNCFWSLLCIPQDCSSDQSIPRCWSALELAHLGVRSRDSRPLHIVKNRSCRKFVDNLSMLVTQNWIHRPQGANVILCRFQIRLLLFPEEKYPEPLHQRRELIGDILKCLRAFLQRINKLTVRVPNFGRHYGVQHLSSNAR